MNNEETTIDTKITIERLYMVYTVNLIVRIIQISFTVYTIGCCWYIVCCITYIRANNYHSSEDHDYFSETWIEHGVEDDWEWNIK